MVDQTRNEESAGNLLSTNNRKRKKKKNGVSLNNLITIDVLHEAIKDDDRCSFMNKLIAKHYPEMDEKH